MIAFRALNPNSTDEINLVASRMRNTLIDVLGREEGESMYTMDWLKELVSWHLSLRKNAKVLLAESEKGEVIAQAIVRIETYLEAHEVG